MSIIDLVQGVYFALKTITKTIKGKGENDLLTKELLISIESIIETLDGLRENGLITDGHRVAWYSNSCEPTNSCEPSN